MQKLLQISELKNCQSRGFDIAGKKVFVVNKDNQFYVYENSCPHLQIELEFNDDDFLDIDNELIICSNHGALFEIQSGNCVAGPCIGDHLEVVKFEIRGGAIYI